MRVLLILFFCLSHLCFAQNENSSKKNFFYIEPELLVHSLRYFENFNFGKSGTDLSWNSQTRLSLNINLGYRNDKLNLALGANTMTIGNSDYSTSMPSFLNTREAYFKLGCNLVSKISDSKVYFGPYGSFGLLILDPHYGFLTYKVGIEFYSSRRLRIGAYFGFFGYTDQSGLAIDKKGFNRFNSNEFGISLAYSFPIRDPWIPHE